MATGYTLPNGSKSYDSRGFEFSQRNDHTWWAGTHLMHMYDVSCQGYVQNWSASDYPAVHWSNSGALYKWDDSARWHQPAGSIGSFIYYKITTSPGTGGTMSGGGNYDSGTTVTITATPSAGYLCTVLGGQVQDGTTGSKSVDVVADVDKVVSATFAKYFEVKFHDGSKSRTQGPLLVGNSSAPNIHQLYTLSTLGWTRTGWKFLGWNTKSDGTGTSYADGGSISSTNSGTIHLYAQWAQYTLTYDANGGSPTPEAQTYYGEITLADAPTKSGSSFFGWIIDEVTYQPGTAYYLAADATAVASWTGYTVTYDANGGSVSPSSDSGVVTLPTPTRTGYTCTGWYTAKTGGTEAGNPGERCAVDGERVHANGEPERRHLRRLHFADGAIHETEVRHDKVARDWRRDADGPHA